MILLLDNYDSFTWNLHHYLVQLTDEQVVVRRNDEITLQEIPAFSCILLSPGPGLPEAAGVMPELIRKYSAGIPMLGICLGHQAIAENFGAKLNNLATVLHGVQREVRIEVPHDRILKGIPEIINTGHYHSWVVSSDNFPAELKITARSTEGEIMALSHSTYPVSGVQFHPESVLTDFGITMIENWLNFCMEYRRVPTPLQSPT